MQKASRGGRSKEAVAQPSEPGQGTCRIGNRPCPSPSATPLQETPEKSQSRPATVENQTPEPAPGRQGDAATRAPSAAAASRLGTMVAGLSRERGRRRLGRPHGQLASGLETGGGAIWIEAGRLSSSSRGFCLGLGTGMYRQWCRSIIGWARWDRRPVVLSNLATPRV